MKISIVVPVYNAAAYLPRFMDSILKATYNLGAEVILVDDCSTDGTSSELDEVKKKGAIERSKIAEGLREERNVRVLHLEANCGVSKARQAGLDLATGEYVIFADPDDWMDDGMYEGLVSAAEASGAEIVFEDFFENDARRDQKFEGDAEELICAILGGRIHGATWNKLIRRSFIEKTGARFCEERLGLCEDVDFLCQLLVKNPKVAYHSGCHYHYITVQGSATHGLSEESFTDLAKVGERLAKILTTPKTSAALLKWRKGNRFAAFVTKNISRKFLKSYETDCRDLHGLETNVVWKILFWIGVRLP